MSSGQGLGVTGRKLRELQRALHRERRLEALRRTALLDTPSEEAFDRLARLATKCVSAPIALVSLVDEDRQFFKSCVGLPAPWCDIRQTPLTHSFCMHVVATAEPLIIEDARQHPVLSENLAVDQLGVVAYAGLPLITSKGETLGTFCVIDTAPHHWTDEDISILSDLTAAVMTEIELRATREMEARAREAEAARVEAEAARQRFALLAELSGELAERSDLSTALTLAVRLSVPLVGDGCVLDLLQEGGRLRRAAVAHLDAREEDRLRNVSDPPSLLSFQQPRAPVSGHVRLTNPEGASVRLPLLGREKVLGAITFTTVPPRRLGSMELELARDVARRVALAVDNDRLHQELLEAIRMRDRFLSIASHELRTPLTALRLQAQSLQRGARGEQPCTAQQVVDKARMIARQVERLGHLVDELLDLSRIREGRLAFHYEDLDLLEVVGDITTRLNEERLRSGSTLVVRGGPVRGRWDRLRLEQVLTNLLTNAMKYGKGRPITVTVAEDEGLARLIVQDEGIGISAEDQTRIFERFERAVSEQHYGGFGLGLWIAREIVKGLGGSISVHSEPGVGSAFTVELPRAVEHEQPGPLLH